MKKKSAEYGFVLITSLIFLVIMTLLAVTAIRRATLDEKVAGNLREQNLAFQAAERALRYCQDEYETKGVSRPSLGLPDMPTEWKTDANWVSGGGAVIELPVGMVKNVIEQPKCMIEPWKMPPPKTKGADVGSVHLITARGVGSTNSAVVWLQVTLRDGSL